MITALLVLSLSQLPAQKCVSASGVTKCGYACTAGGGEVKCAATPLGACVSAYGEVTCWDPSAAVLRAATQRTAPAQCVAASGKVACGWSCVAHAGEVRCAQTPGGVCAGNGGQIVCSEAVAQPRYDDRPRYRDVPQQECLSKYGKTVCGYGCVAGYGEVKCATRPGGVCQAAYGEITCSN